MNDSDERLPITNEPPASAACGGLRPNRPDTGRAGEEKWVFEESRTWKQSGGAGSKAPEGYRATHGRAVGSRIIG